VIFPPGISEYCDFPTGYFIEFLEDPNVSLGIVIFLYCDGIVILPHTVIFPSGISYCDFPTGYFVDFFTLCFFCWVIQQPSSYTKFNCTILPVFPRSKQQIRTMPKSAPAPEVLEEEKDVNEEEENAIVCRAACVTISKRNIFK